MRRPELILCALFCGLALAPASAATVEELIERNRHTLDGIHDFTTTLTFTVKSKSVRVPRSRAKLFYKQPDKFKAKPLDGDVTVLPRTWRFAVSNVLSRLAHDHALSLLREESYHDRPHYVLKAVPKAKDDPLEYHLLWLDSEHATVTLMRSYPKQGPPASLAVTYLKQGQGWLPSRADVEGTAQRKGGGDEKFAVTLAFADYAVNTGLSDSLFDEPKKGK